MLRFTARKLIPHVDEMVELKNKTKVPAAAVTLTMQKLTNLYSRNRVAFYELIHKCRNPKFEIHSHFLSLLKNSGLTAHDGSLDEVTKNIILSAILNDKWDITLESPITHDIPNKSAVITSMTRSKL